MFHFYKRTIMMYLHVRTSTHVYVIEIGKGISVGANKAKEYEQIKGYYGRVLFDLFAEIIITTEENIKHK